MTKIQEYSEAIELFRRLQPIAKTIHRLDENSCNYELSKSQETRLTNLLEKATRTAAIFGLRIYHQSDPRGASLYIMPHETEADWNDYNRIGIAVY